jgi:hypothetical protein
MRGSQGPFACAICFASYPAEADRVAIDASWRVTVERVCEPCWSTMIQASKAAILAQQELPSPN